MMMVCVWVFVCLMENETTFTTAVGFVCAAAPSLIYAALTVRYSVYESWELTTRATIVYTNYNNTMRLPLTALMYSHSRAIYYCSVCCRGDDDGSLTHRHAHIRAHTRAQISINLLCAMRLFGNYTRAVHQHSTAAQRWREIGVLTSRRVFALVVTKLL